MEKPMEIVEFQSIHKGGHFLFNPLTSQEVVNFNPFASTSLIKFSRKKLKFFRQMTINLN